MFKVNNCIWNASYVPAGNHRFKQEPDMVVAGDLAESRQEFQRVVRLPGGLQLNITIKDATIEGDWARAVKLQNTITEPATNEGVPIKLNGLVFEGCTFVSTHND